MVSLRSKGDNKWVRAFTLTECAVVLTVLAIAVAAAAPQISKFKEDTDLRNAALQVQSDLRLACRTACSRHIQSIVAFGGAGGSTYTILYDSDMDRTADSGELLRTRALPGGIYISQLALTPADSVIFIPTGTLANPGEGGSITLSNERGGSSTVQVWSSGSVEITR